MEDTSSFGVGLASRTLASWRALRSRMGWGLLLRSGLWMRLVETLLELSVVMGFGAVVVCLLG